MAKGAKPRADIDWDAMLPEWRAGKASLTDLSRRYGVSRAGIEKHWAKLDEHRDLNGKIQAKAEAIVAQAQMVADAKVTNAVARAATERETVAANAQAVADVLIGHRSDIRRHRAVVSGLLAELEAQVANPELFEELGELLRSPGVNGQDRLNEVYRRVIDLPGKVDSSRKLAESLKVLIALEREAFNVKTSPDGEDPLKAMGEKIGMSAAEAWKLSINAIS